MAIGRSPTNEVVRILRRGGVKAALSVKRVLSQSRGVRIFDLDELGMAPHEAENCIQDFDCFVRRRRYDGEHEIGSHLVVEDERRRAEDLPPLDGFTMIGPHGREPLTLHL